GGIRIGDRDMSEFLPAHFEGTRTVFFVEKQVAAQGIAMAPATDRDRLDIASGIEGGTRQGTRHLGANRALEALERGPQQAGPSHRHLVAYRRAGLRQRAAHKIANEFLIRDAGPATKGDQYRF